MHEKEGEMPHEKINYSRTEEGMDLQAVVGWDKMGWVQLSMYPKGWGNTGDAWHVPLSDGELDKLIKVLKRAKRQAYSGKHRHYGFETREVPPTGTDIFLKR